MGSRYASHQLSNGLFVSGRPEQPKEKPPTMSSVATPYTGGDIKKSGELGKMFDIPTDGTKSRKSGPITGASSRSGQQPGPGGPNATGRMSGSLASAGSNSMKKTNSGPLSKHGEPLKKSSGPQSGNSGPIPILPTTGLITSGPITSGPLNSSGAPRKISAKHTTALRRMYRKPIDFLEEQTTGMADMILVNSNFTASTFAKTFKRLHARGSRPAVLYPAVNVDQFNEPHAHKLNFLSINRFEKKKNIDLAVSAFAILCKHKQTLSDDVTLTVAGGYDERLKENVEYLEELKSLAEKEGVSNRVSFITSCSTAERNELLSSCLCVLYTPTDEHFGIVPLEAMAAYKPVIACNSGGPVETVKSGATGYLCEPSPEDFSSVMAKFVEDPELARRMGSEARRHVVESFSVKTFGEKLNQYLVDVVSSPKED
ncbi:hypothetical protein F2Q68_00046678 [Brassica cretica]|uniref:Alpha-1,3/1,6-mannosyltransferase ALG2 n=1 Tax=Brassica cretica TaxID=69181 RepID=A0A8S9LTA0_BRACR|nr:hypothetical protein F2Q68_00046678 [Brassica cretica]